jgi:hypothetical protein
MSPMLAAAPGDGATLPAQSGGSGTHLPCLACVRWHGSEGMYDHAECAASEASMGTGATSAISSVIRDLVEDLAMQDISSAAVPRDVSLVSGGWHPAFIQHTTPLHSVSMSSFTSAHLSTD